MFVASKVLTEVRVKLLSSAILPIVNLANEPGEVDVSLTTNVSPGLKYLLNSVSSLPSTDTLPLCKETKPSPGN